MFDVDLVRQDFPGTHGQVYLNSASIGLPAIDEKGNQHL